ncbi:MAG: protein phosphatase 2C domain-containing protein [Tannerella sp.]|jgi:protein phosphatase|nr:protein phosphatase 2C domain-containing protein [Tannerella sp.]
MNISLGRPFAICEKGHRLNNEDCILPLSELADSNQKLFMVCDGVGGSEKGEVASLLTCESIDAFFSTFLEGDPTEDFIKKAVQYTETRFDEYIAGHPEAKGMATTMTLVYFGEESVTVAHIGDSRVYQFRNGQPVFVTEDHSLVNTWVKLGTITPEEALTHPKRNVITRAIQGTFHPAEADVVHLTDVQPDDFILMCTDGVTESITDEALSQVVKDNNSAEGIKNTLVEICSDFSRDNYSFYVLPIQNIQNSLNYRQFLSSFFYFFT